MSSLAGMGKLQGKFKLQVITFAEDKGTRAAGREFSVVRDWRKQKSKLKKCLLFIGL